MSLPTAVADVPHTAFVTATHPRAHRATGAAGARHGHPTAPEEQGTAPPTAPTTHASPTAVLLNCLQTPYSTSPALM